MLYALHVPEVERIGKGKTRQPYEFGVKTSFAVTLRQGLVVGVRSFPGNPYDGHTLSEQLQQTTTLLQDIGTALKTVKVLEAASGVKQRYVIEQAASGGAVRAWPLRAGQESCLRDVELVRAR